MKKNAEIEDINISLIVNIHREAKYIARTFRSLSDTIHHAQVNHLTCEVILVLDRSDEATRKAVSAWQDLIPCKKAVIEVDNGSLALSRMSGLTVAKGHFVSLHDADDLVSYNYITEKYNACVKDKNAIVLPELMVSFGAKEWVTFYCGVDPRVLVDTHPYISQIFCRREILNSVSYLHPRPEAHRAYEDWHVNTLLIAEGHHFVNAPGSVLFYRQRPDSIMGQEAGRAVRRIIEPSCFFAPKKYLNCLAMHDFSTQKNQGKETRESISKRLASATFHLTLDAAAQIEPQVSIDPQKLAGIHSYIDTPTCGGLIYEKICSISHDDKFPWEHIFILPSLCIGGGEKFLIQVAESIHYHTHKKSLFITTDVNEDNTWKARIDAFCDHIHLATAGQTNDSESLILGLSNALIRISENSSSKVHVHVKTAPDGYFLQDLAAPYLPKRTFVNYRFSDDVNPHNMRESLSAFTLKQIEKHLNQNIVIADYDGIRERDQKYFGTEIKDYFTVRAYTQINDKSIAFSAPQRKRLLWISRYSEHKRVSILPELARAIRMHFADIQIDLYAPGIKPHEAASISKINKNFSFRKSVSSFSEIDTDHYDALIYTSLLDGIPNVLIEAMSNALPAIAPVIGGIPELISDGINGILIESCCGDVEMCDNYVTAIKALYSLSDDERFQMRLNAREFIAKHHSETSHRKAIHDIFQHTQ